MLRSVPRRRGAALIFAVFVSLVVMLLAVAVSSLAYSGQDQAQLALQRTQAEVGAAAAADLALDWVRALPASATDVTDRLPAGEVTGSLDGACYGFALERAGVGLISAESWARSPAPESGCPATGDSSQAASVITELAGPEDDPAGWQRRATQIP